MAKVKKTLKVRVRDKHADILRAMSIEVNQVWNYCNDLNRHLYHQTQKYFSAFDLNYYLKGWSKTESELIGSSTIQETAAVLAKSTFQHKRVLWRRSFGKRRSLGWVPFKSRAAIWRDGKVRFAGTIFDVWDSYGLAGYTFRAGQFVEDSTGRWFFCVVVEVEVNHKKAQKEVVGIDLGLEESATTSDGDVLQSRWYRNNEERLAKAQRAGHKKRARNIQRKTRNQRLDAHHKFSTKLVKEYQSIRVGNVSSQAMIKRKRGFAKSTLDASWAQLKTLLKYKSQQACRGYEEVNEAYTTQTCSACGCRSGPKGLKGLRIRHWTCCECGISHDRDVNSARLIAGVGHGPQVVGIPVL